MIHSFLKAPSTSPIALVDKRLKKMAVFTELDSSPLNFLYNLFMYVLKVSKFSWVGFPFLNKSDMHNRHALSAGCQLRLGFDFLLNIFSSLLRWFAGSDRQTLV